MAGNLLQQPYFAIGSEDDLNYALSNPDGVFFNLTRIAYVYLKDTGELAFIDTNKDIHKIVGNNKSLVQRVDALPSDGDKDVLYILNDVTYTYDGQQYIPTCQIALDELDKKADKATTLAGYGITDTYTDKEIDEKLENLNTQVVEDIVVVAQDVVVVQQEIQQLAEETEKALTLIEI